jgi:cytochrome c556
MRDASSSLRAAIEKQDKAAAEKAMTGLTQNCETCHKAFRVEE